MDLNTLRPELEPLPARMRKLPIDARGYVVPWFVKWQPGADGVNVPDFRLMDRDKYSLAIKSRRCWVCGEPLGVWLAFAIGPMCAVNRTTSEPPAHRECATWSIRNCPFLSQPHTVRRETDLPANVVEAPGHMLRRNPGVMCLWITRSFEQFPDQQRRPLITIGPAETVEWWRERRPATRAEVVESITAGLPALLDLARRDGSFGVSILEQQYERTRSLFPQEITR